MEYRECLICRPGDFSMTDQLFRDWAENKPWTVLDLGCGSGATVHYLREKFPRWQVYGIDPCWESQGDGFVRGKAEKLPWRNHLARAVLMECSLSVMDDPGEVLKECYRVLDKGGRLLVSDIYARGEEGQFHGLLGRAWKKETIKELLTLAGFQILSWEDVSSELDQMFGQMIMDLGVGGFYERLGGSREEIRRSRCGYFLCVAEKLEDYHE